jgi:TrmH family RNA methyltransferase
MPGHPLSLDPISRARAKIIADLDRASARKKHGLFRIEGWRGLASAIAAGAKLEDIVVREAALDTDRIELLRRSGAARITSINPKGMARLTSVLEDQGVAATAATHLDDIPSLRDAERVVTLDGVQDPGNVGTIIRTAAWFGIDGVVADAGTADFFNPKVVRAAAGALWDLTLVRTDSLVDALRQLKSKGFSCYGTEVGGEDSGMLTGAPKSVLVLGSEGHGLSEDVRAVVDRFVSIEGRHRPRHGVESLNVAVAGSILLARWVEGTGRPS